jgi:sugar phosphate isomerase/epimerase
VGKSDVPESLDRLLLPLLSEKVYFRPAGALSAPADLLHGTEAVVYVACSTLCFTRYPLDQALRIIGELDFSKVDVAIHEKGPHLRPSQVAKDVAAAAQRIRIGPSLSPAAFNVEIDAQGEEFIRQLRAVCRLARLSNVATVTLSAAPAGSPLDAEVSRLQRLTRLAQAEGVILCLETRMGTLAEMPGTAVELCERVDGLGLTLDPSHFLAGPNQGQNYDVVFPYVRHVHLRDSGRSMEKFQVQVGQGEIEYGRIIAQLARHHYERLLTVEILDIPDAPFAIDHEVRKLKYLLESLV